MGNNNAATKYSLIPDPQEHDNYQQDNQKNDQKNEHNYYMINLILQPANENTLAIIKQHVYSNPEIKHRIYYYDSRYGTLLYFACKYSRQSSLEIIKLLIDLGFSVNSTSNYNNSTPLITSVGFTTTTSSLDTIKLLLDNGANIDIKNKYGNTALLCATKLAHKSSNLETINLLLDHGANINAKNIYGQTSLMRTVLTNNFDATRLLLSRGADCNILNNDNKTVYNLIKEQPITTDQLKIRKLLKNHMKTN